MHFFLAAYKCVDICILSKGNCIISKDFISEFNCGFKDEFINNEQQEQFLSAWNEFSNHTQLKNLAILLSHPECEVSECYLFVILEHLLSLVFEHAGYNEKLTGKLSEIRDDDIQFWNALVQKRHLLSGNFAPDNDRIINRYGEYKDDPNLVYLGYHFTRDFISKLKKLTIPDFFVSCFSGKYHDPVMWSHYANSNKGICLVYLAHNIGDHYEIEGKDENIHLKKVNYKYKPLRMDFFGSSGFFGDGLTRKPVSCPSYQPEFC